MLVGAIILMYMEGIISEEEIQRQYGLNIITLEDLEEILEAINELS